jgi:hypothetical protein
MASQAPGWSIGIAGIDMPWKLQPTGDARIRQLTMTRSATERLEPSKTNQVHDVERTNL